MMTVGERIVTVGVGCFLAGMAFGMLFLMLLNRSIEERNDRLAQKVKEAKIFEPVIL